MPFPLKIEKDLPLHHTPPAHHHPPHSDRYNYKYPIGITKHCIYAQTRTVVFLPFLMYRVTIEKSRIDSPYFFTIPKPYGLPL